MFVGVPLLTSLFGSYIADVSSVVLVIDFIDSGRRVCYMNT